MVLFQCDAQGLGKFFLTGIVSVSERRECDNFIGHTPVKEFSFPVIMYLYRMDFAFDRNHGLSDFCHIDFRF